MQILLAGLIIFFGMHLVPAMTGVHAKLQAQFGQWGWKGIMAVISIIGFVMIVIGWQRTGHVAVYEPFAYGREITRAVMLPAFILLIAAYAPSNIKRFTRHPMLWATVLWSVGHLLANGDLRSLLVFGSFLIWSLFDMWSCNRRGAQLASAKKSIGFDIGVILAGIVVYALAARFHVYFTGVPLAM